jgi:hypothetical protein
MVYNQVLRVTMATVSKILYTFTGGYLDFEVLDLNLPGLYVNLALQATIYLRGLSKINMIHKLYINHEDKYYMRNKNNKITQKTTIKTGAC